MKGYGDNNSIKVGNSLLQKKNDDHKLMRPQKMELGKKRL